MATRRCSSAQRRKEELILFAGGLAAQGGHLKLQWVIAAAFLGSLLGDMSYFLLGRLKGKKFLKRRPRWKVGVEKALVLLERHQKLSVIGLRFMSGLRTVTPFALGLTSISIPRFFMLDMIGALGWSIGGSLVGYALGMAAQAIGIDVKKYEHWIILGMLCAGALVVMIGFLRGRRARG